MFEQIEKEIIKIDGSQVIGSVGKANEYPFYQIKRGVGSNKVLLSGVLHGDEPAGAYAIIHFFQSISHVYENDFEFTAFPCTNPYGFEHNARENAFNLNLNREFKHDSTSQETQLIMARLEKYLFTMDLHETWPDSTRVEGYSEPVGEGPDSFYFWEYCRQKDKRVGTQILRNILEAGINVCTWDKIYDDNNNGGVIWFPEDCKTECFDSDAVFDAYLEKFHTTHSFTIETARNEALEDRVKAYMISLTTVLGHYRQSLREKIIE